MRLITVKGQTKEPSELPVVARNPTRNTTLHPTSRDNMASRDVDDAQLPIISYPRE